MKHNLFRNFTALLLSGAMLAGVGCKDYDDDIDNINKRLDGMEVTISSLSEQIEAIEASISDLSALSSRVATLEGQLEGVTDLKGQLDALKTLESDLKTYVDNATSAATSAEALRNTLDAYYATAGALSTLEDTLASLTNKDGVIDQIKSDISDIESDITAMKDNASAWLGEAMKTYLTDYATKSYVSTDESVTAILEQIQAEQDKYQETLQEIISGAIVGEDGNFKIGSVGMNQLDDALKTLIEKITPLIDRVNELEGRIQSLVYVPSTLEEATSNTIWFEGASYIIMSDDPDAVEPILYLSQTDKQTAKITFRVSPASLAKKIVEEGTLSIVTEKITRADAGEDLFTVTDVEAEKTGEGENVEYTGKFTVTAETSYIYGSETGKTLAIALNVNVPAEAEGSTQGIDYTTSFIGTDYKEGGDISSKLVIAKEIEEGDFFELANNGTYSTDLEYNSTETVTFLDGFAVYYKDDNTYTALTKWENAPKLTITTPDAETDATTVSGTEDAYEFDQTSVKIADSKVSLIGNTITSGYFTFALSDGTNTRTIGKVNHKVTIVGDNTDITTNDIQMNWQYAKATSNNTYAIENVELKKNENGENILSPDVFKGLASDTKEIKLYKNGQEVSGITADIEITSNPSVITDAQLIKVTLTGDLKESADYVLKAVYSHDDKTTSTIIANVKVVGMPTLPDYDLSNGTVSIKTFEGSNTFDMLNDFGAAYAKAVWNDELKAAFGTEDDLADFISNANVTSDDNNGKASLSVSGTKIVVTFDSDAVFGTKYSPSITFAHASITGLQVTFTSNVQLDKPADATLKRNSIFFKEDGKALANTNISGNSFSVVAKPLGDAFECSSDIAGLKINYSINEDLTDFAGTAPEINNSYLYWNDWSELELEVKVELVLNDRTLDETTFIVKINDPVASAITVDSEVDATIYAGETDNTFTVASMLQLAAQNGTNVFDPTGSEQGLNDDLREALTGSATYTLAEGSNPIISLDTDGKGILTLGESSLEISEFSVTVKVVYSYQFGTREFDATIKVKPGTKPAVEP